VIAGAGDVESFNTLRRRARLRGRSTPNALPVSFVAFELLWHDGTDLTGCGKTPRAVSNPPVPPKASSLFGHNAAALLSIAAAHGLEA